MGGGERSRHVVKQLEVEDSLEEAGNVKLIAKAPSGQGAQAFPHLTQVIIKLLPTYTHSSTFFM